MAIKSSKNMGSVFFLFLWWLLIAKWNSIIWYFSPHSTRKIGVRTWVHKIFQQFNIYSLSGCPIGQWASAEASAGGAARSAAFLHLWDVHCRILSWRHAPCGCINYRYNNISVHTFLRIWIEIWIHIWIRIHIRSKGLVQLSQNLNLNPLFFNLLLISSWA